MISLWALWALWLTVFIHLKTGIWVQSHGSSGPGGGFSGSGTG